MQKWHLFTGEGEPRHVDIPLAPPWRSFGEKVESDATDWSFKPDAKDRYWKRARAYRTPSAILDAVNAALVLRRPLLVTGPPGAGKSSLIYRVAFELGLGPVLVWPVNSRTTIESGLYDYDAIARLRDQNLGAAEAKDIGRYISLRALGTVLLPSPRPRALLIDELDKADPDLPNDLLNIFEEGWFEIPELQRHDIRQVNVRVADSIDSAGQGSTRASIVSGRIQCSEFPFIVLTSNGEREFPAAFLRRCIRVELEQPDVDQLADIVEAHIGKTVAQAARGQIDEFAKSGESVATDQLLNALYIVHKVNGVDDDAAQRLHRLLTRSLA
jgi:MoxR-like ATPase